MRLANEMMLRHPGCESLCTRASAHLIEPAYATRPRAGVILVGLLGRIFGKWRWSTDCQSEAAEVRAVPECMVLRSQVKAFARPRHVECSCTSRYRSTSTRHSIGSSETRRDSSSSSSREGRPQTRGSTAAGLAALRGARRWRRWRWCHHLLALGARMPGAHRALMCMCGPRSETEVAPRVRTPGRRGRRAERTNNFFAFVRETNLENWV